MRFTIPVITSLEEDQIILLQPQFNIRIQEAIGMPMDRIIARLTILISSKIRRILVNGQRLPEIIQKEKYEEEDNYQSKMWIVINVDIGVKDSLCKGLLPVLGHVSNIGSLLGNSMSSLMSIKLAAAESAEVTQWGVGIPSSLLNFVILMIIYQYSGATKMLEGIGRALDDMPKQVSVYEPKIVPILDHNRGVRCCQYPNGKRTIMILALVGIAFLQIISSINTYQDIISKGLRLGISVNSLSYNLILGLAWGTMISQSLSSAIFQGAFAKDFSEEVSAVKKYNIRFRYQDPPLSGSQEDESFVDDENNLRISGI